MKKKRERLDVIHDILSCVQSKKRIGPTRLLQLSNLSPQMFREYLSNLIESELLEEKVTRGKKEFELTEKGHIFLDRHKVFSNFIEQLGL